MQRNSLFILLLALALLLAAPAKAQPFVDCQPGLMWGDSDSGIQEFFILFATWGTPYWFTIYSCPAPPTWVSHNLSHNRAWFSTCPQGGLAQQRYDLSPPYAPYPYQLTQDSELKNPIYTQMTQGMDTGFVYAHGTDIPPQPEWQEGVSTGGPCGPTQ